MKKTMLLLISITFMLLMVSCTKSKEEKPLLVKNVSSIEISHGNGSKITYTPDKNLKEIEELIKAYNEENPLGKIANRTPDTKLTINFKNGKAMMTMN